MASGDVIAERSDAPYMNLIWAATR
jgi:hypothetical protein